MPNDAIRECRLELADLGPSEIRIVVDYYLLQVFYTESPIKKVMKKVGVWLPVRHLK